MNKALYVSRADIDAMDERYRINFVNALSGFKSANLLASCDSENNLNVAMFSSAVHLGANPPLLAIVARPDTVARHSLENIRASGFFSLNAVGESFFQQAHHCSARSEREESEFDFSGLDAEFVDGFTAPFVRQSALKIALKLQEILPVKSNGTSLVIAEVLAVYLPDKALHADGFIDHQALHSVCVSGLDSYHSVNAGERLAYAKKNQPVKKQVRG
jgi:flavin reductase (DIM6/NTAB) family NADH-FMN oxidoreductase RutF